MIDANVSHDNLIEPVKGSALTQYSAGNDHHVSVLLRETLDALLAQMAGQHAAVQQTSVPSSLMPQTLPTAANGIFIDATFGRGGHSKALLARLDANSQLIAFDKDPQALAVGQQLMAEDSRFRIIHSSFAQIQQQIQQLGISQVDGIMADLGVSSPQLDDAQRGFSFMQDGPLDMRMNNATGKTAAEFIENTDVDDLANILYQYGEERHSRRIARAIKQAGALSGTRELAEIIKAAHPKWEKHKHPATRSFQAIRIALNGELDDLISFLPQAVALLKPNARLAVISFHSLEDRIVKQFIAQSSSDAMDSLGFPIKGGAKTLKKLERVCASEQELAHNPRARSAWLRVASKL